MDCGGVIVKYILFLFNILCLVCGILLIVFGSLMVSHINEYNTAADTFLANSICISVLVLGCVIFFISFLGCCGAIRENTCFTFTYSLFMLGLLILQIALTVYVWTQNAEIIAALDTVVNNIWNQRETDQSVMNAMQLSLKCCGKNSCLDYTLSGGAVPNSCCGPQATSCNCLIAGTKPGCVSAFEEMWTTNLNIICYAGIGVAVLELVAFIFACCLGNQFRNSHRRANY